MTLPNLISPTAELIAYRDELKAKIVHLRNFSAAYPDDSYPLKLIRHYEDEAIELLDILNRRESCPHEDFTENMEGRKCRTCGLETK